MRTELKIGNKPTGLYAVDVPVNSFDYRLMSSHRLVYDVDNYPKQLMYSVLLVIPGNYHKILGPITEHEIGFDCEPYIEKVGNATFKDFLRGTVDISSFKDTSLFGTFVCRTKEESFYSLLQSNGIYFVNPMGVPPQFITEPENERQAMEIADIAVTYKAYQDLLVQKLLIIQKK